MASIEVKNDQCATKMWCNLRKTEYIYNHFDVLIGRKISRKQVT